MGEETILVKFRFDDESEPKVGRFTYEQYDNLRSLPVVVECKIISEGKPTLSESDMETINKKISEACGSDKGHTSRLSK